jgi:hypothetical protein
MHIYYYTNCAHEMGNIIFGVECVRKKTISKLFRIAGKLHDRIEDNYMITLTDCSACSLQWGHISSPSLMLEEQWLHKKKTHGKNTVFLGLTLQTVHNAATGAVRPRTLGWDRVSRPRPRRPRTVPEDAAGRIAAVFGSRRGLREGGRTKSPPGLRLAGGWRLRWPRPVGAGWLAVSSKTSAQLTSSWASYSAGTATSADTSGSAFSTGSAGLTGSSATPLSKGAAGLAVPARYRCLGWTTDSTVPSGWSWWPSWCKATPSSTGALR